MSIQLNFNEIFTVNEGIITTMLTVEIGGVTIEAGDQIPDGTVLEDETDLTKYKDRYFLVDHIGDVYHIVGIYKPGGFFKNLFG